MMKSVLMSLGLSLVAVGCYEQAEVSKPRVQDNETHAARSHISQLLQEIQTKDTVIVIASNVGVSVGTSTLGVNYFYAEDIAHLVKAGLDLNIPVCNIRPEKLALPGPSGMTPGLDLETVLDACENRATVDQRVLQALSELKTETTHIIIGANAAATYGTTNHGVNYFYDDEIESVSRAADLLGISVCSIAPQPLSLPTLKGMSPGLDIEEALKACGETH